MEIYTKLSSQTAGKDKIARLIQYGSKLLSYLIEIRIGQIEVADQLQHLEFHFGTFRKLLRLGKSVEVLHGILKSLHIRDITLRSLITLSRIAQSIFLLADHIIWVGRAGLIRVNANRWRNLANKCWIYSITINLLRDLYEIKLASKQYHPSSTTVAQMSSSSSLVVQSSVVQKCVSCLPLFTAFCVDHKDISVDTVKNICDIFIPLTSQGHVNLNPGIVGLLGVVSTIAGIYALIDPSAKICPS